MPLRTEKVRVAPISSCQLPKILDGVEFWWWPIWLGRGGLGQAKKRPLVTVPPSLNCPAEGSGEVWTQQASLPRRGRKNDKGVRVAHPTDFRRVYLDTLAEGSCASIGPQHRERAVDSGCRKKGGYPPYIGCKQPRKPPQIRSKSDRDRGTTMETGDRPLIQEGRLSNRPISVCCNGPIRTDPTE